VNQVTSIKKGQAITKAVRITDMSYPRGLDSAQVSDNERELTVQFGQQEGQKVADNNGQSSIQLILHIVNG
jgi:hypothetical protein